MACSSKTANHVTATQYIKHAGIVETFSFFAQPNFRMGNLSDVDRGMIVGTRRGGSSISETALQSLVFTENCAMNKTSSA